MTSESHIASIDYRATIVVRSFICECDVALEQYRMYVPMYATYVCHNVITIIPSASTLLRHTLFNSPKAVFAHHIVMIVDLKILLYLVNMCSGVYLSWIPFNNQLLIDLWRCILNNLHILINYHKSIICAHKKVTLFMIHTKLNKTLYILVTMQC